MANALAHRMPDDRKVLTDGCVGLGHGLMRITTEDQFEEQPLRDRDADLTLVADLRLDNREELAIAFGIGAAALRDMPDSGLLMHAYKKWGEACAAHLLGDFAFAIWDGRAKKLVLGRDHMGQRAIFHHRDTERFVFASEAKALHAFADVPHTLTDAHIGRMLMHDLTLRRPRREAYGIPAATVTTVGIDGRWRNAAIGSRAPIRRTKAVTKPIMSRLIAACSAKPWPAGCGGLHVRPVSFSAAATTVRRLPGWPARRSRAAS